MDMSGATRLFEKNDFKKITVLLLIASAIGFYLAFTTVLISQDGVGYIERAQQLADNPVQIIKWHPPGYPFLIMVTHDLSKLFTKGTSALSWIHSAQFVTILCMLLAFIPLYFIGKLLVGSRDSFLALLIFIFLPYPAELACSVVRGWPYIMFLSIGLFFLLWAIKYGKWRAFSIVGLSSGLGCLIRPESAQLVLYGSLWVILSLCRPKLWGVTRIKIIASLALLIIGFAMPVVPYMKCVGHVIPRNYIIKPVSNILPDKSDGFKGDVIEAVNTAEMLPGDVLKALAGIFNKTGETLMWVFMLFLLIGLYSHFHQKVEFQDRYLITVFILANMSSVILRYCYVQPHVSQRWCLPMVAVTVFYIPIGLRVVGDWLGRKQRVDYPKDKRSFWFVTLLLIGIGICIPKLLRPARIEKQGYRDAADWLRMNTPVDEVIAVYDRRIAFYAERRRVKMTDNLPEDVNYLVDIILKSDDPESVSKLSQPNSPVWVDARGNKKKVVIYKKL